MLSSACCVWRGSCRTASKAVLLFGDVTRWGRVSFASSASSSSPSSSSSSPSSSLLGEEEVKEKLNEKRVRELAAERQAHPFMPRAPLVQFPRSMPRSVPERITRPQYVLSGVVPEPKPLGTKSPDIVFRMRRANALAAYVRRYAGSLVKPGATPDEIDRAAHDLIVSFDAYPSALGYHRFPKALCSSVNEVICHGIPDTRPLEEGDIVKLDVVVYLDGVHGDCCGTFRVGEVSDEAALLDDVTRQSLDHAISICGAGVPFNRIGDAICEITEPHGFGVVSSYSGHGIGENIHELPFVLHYRNDFESGIMEKTHTFTIEPMITAGSPNIKHWDDGWTVVSEDGSLAAQYEETLLINDDGSPEILSMPDLWDDLKNQKPPN